MDERQLEELEIIIENDYDEFAEIMMLGNGVEFYELQGVWEDPTEIIKTEFPIWIKTSKDIEISFYKTYDNHDKRPANLMDLEFERLGTELILFFKQMNQFIESKQSSKAYLSLAKLVGKIEYLRKLAIAEHLQLSKAFEKYKDLLQPTNKVTPKRMFDEFSDFLRDPRPGILNALKKIYSHPQEKKELAYMMFALHDLGELRFDDPRYKQSKLFKALKKFLDGDIGTQQNNSTYLNLLNRTTEINESEIQLHCKLIKDELDSL